MRTPLRNVAITPLLFTSRKCKVAIPCHTLLRDALQQASLEPAVRAIRYRPAPHGPGVHALLAGVVIKRMDGDFLLRVCELIPQRSVAERVRLAALLEAHGLRLLERDALDIRRDPLFSNARSVWSYERYNVSVQDRLKFAVALAEDGPQSIVELEERARPACDVLAAVCALACENLVELNLHETMLGPRTMVRAR